MSDLNRVNVIGRLTKDGELRYSQTGTAMIVFSLAVSDVKPSRSGGYEEYTHFLNDIVYFGKSAEKLAQYLTRGRRIAIDGKLDYQTWQDRDTGANRSKLTVRVLEIFLLDAPQGQSQGQPQRREYDDYGQPIAPQPRAPRPQPSYNPQQGYRPDQSIQDGLAMFDDGAGPEGFTDDQIPF